MSDNGKVRKPDCCFVAVGGTSVTVVSTPMSGTMLRLLKAGAHCHGVTYTRSEYNALKRWYPAPDDKGIAQAMNEAALLRTARRHGLRLMAVLAPMLEPHEDPVKYLLRMMADVGCDVDGSNLEWANGD